MQTGKSQKTEIDHGAIAVLAAGLMSDMGAEKPARLAPTDLIGAWHAVRLGNRVLPENARLTLTFTTGGKFRAKAGPVVFRGRYTIENGELKFVSWLKTAIQGDRAAELIDMRLQRVLEHGEGWRVVDDMLLAGNGGSRPMSLFERVTPSA